MFTGFNSITGRNRTTMRCSYIGSNTSLATTQTITFPAQSIGPAFNDRYVAVIVGGFAPGGTTWFPDSVTIGGASTQQQVSAAGANSDDPIVVIHWTDAVFPTGTTADIVIDWGAGHSSTRCCIAVYSMGGLGGLYNYGWFAFQDDGSELLGTQSTREGGITISAAVFKTASVSVTWSGSMGLTKDADINASGSILSVASRVNTPCVSWAEVKAAPSTRNNNDSIICLSHIPP